MQKTTPTILFCIIIWLISTSFSFNDISELPAKKISRSIEKTWKTNDFSLVETDEANAKSCLSNGLFVQVLSKGRLLGYVYTGRVNSCKSGGCSADNNTELSFEYFDFYALLDTNKAIALLKIYNYQATQGHEVMSRAWLKQFTGLKRGQQVVLGKDIEAISGATVSATKLIENIHQVLSCI